MTYFRMRVNAVLVLSKPHNAAISVPKVTLNASVIDGRRDMTEMELCTTYRRQGDKCTISCKLGLWSVEGPYGLDLINEANHYFQQYKSDGEYSQILGGDSPIEKILKAGNPVAEE